MSIVFSRDGFRALRWVYGVTLLGIGVAVALVLGSYWYWQFEKRNDEQSVRAQREINSRVDNARRELNDLRESAQNYQRLIATGMFVSESRLDLVEAMAALKQRHQLLSMRYTVKPQRPLNIVNANYPAVDVLASRVELTVRATHDGDLVSFLDEFPRLKRGFFPLDRCVMKRLDRRTGATGAADQAASSAESSTDTRAKVEAICALEWITLRDKRNPVTARAEIVRPL
jgi:hypothetical protein